MEHFTGWDESFADSVQKYGGYFNAHCHIDRADTLQRKYLAHMSMDPIEAASYPLRVKQHMTGDLHRGPAYEKEDLEHRMKKQLLNMHKTGTTQVTSFVDTTADNVKLTALNTALKLKKELKDKIKFHIAAYQIFGFKKSQPERLELFIDAVKKADLIGSLPERDDAPGHIGYDEHLKLTLEIAQNYEKPVHVHVDQANDPSEKGTETLIDAVRFCMDEKYFDNEKEPFVWAVHSISPSAYDELRFKKMLEGLLKYNIGVICCPSAAISMRQLRPIKTETHNSIARVLDMVEAGVKLRIGTDNIADVFVPSGTPDMFKEMWLLSNAVRFYNPDILAKIAAGAELTEMDREIVHQVLEQDREVFKKIQ
ncbi:amidohydrolase family protein [Candidatus Woesearchaeota archaeon]|nr:amidohydrolase family protein [Candidatus Woesearchaeota archaeon]